MSQTISGYFTSPVTLAAGSSYASPTTFSGTVNDSSFNAALYIESPWSVDITGTLSNSVFGVFGQSVGDHREPGLYSRQLLQRHRPFCWRHGLQCRLRHHHRRTAGRLRPVQIRTTITNAGYLLGGYYGVKTGPGLISNASTGTILGGSIAVNSAEFATITNAGLIHARDSHGIGISLANGGIIANTGTIQAYTALLLHGGTFTNAGLVQGETLDTVTGTITPSAGGTAISFTAPGSFIEDATGIVLGSIAGAGGTLQMNGGSLGEVSGFAADMFGPGAHATLGASLAGLGTISGFAPGDVLHITDQPAGSGIFIGQDLTLSFAGAYLGTIAFSGTYASNAFSVTADPAGGTDITIPCFCAGTRIATPVRRSPS